MGQILRKVFSFRHFGSQINKMARYILMLYEGGGLLGSLARGKLTDVLPNHRKLLMCLGILFSLISTLGLAIGQHFFNVRVIFVFNTLAGIALCVIHIPLFNAVLQDTYPKNTGLVILVVNCPTEIGVLILGQVKTLILTLTNGTGVVFFLVFFFFVLFFLPTMMSLVVCVPLDPEYKRQKASDIESKAKKDVPLLNDENEPEN